MPRTQEQTRKLCYGMQRSANGVKTPCIRRATVKKNGLDYCESCAKSVRKESK